MRCKNGTFFFCLQGVSLTISQGRGREGGVGGGGGKEANGMGECIHTENI